MTRRPIVGPARVFAAVLGGTAAGVLFPDRLRLDHRFPLVAMVAWRPQAAALTALTAAALAIRPARRPAAAALGAVAVAALAELGGRALRRRPGSAPAAGGAQAEITVLVANVRNGRADTGALTTLIERTTPDFVVLPEAGPDYRDKLMPSLEVLGYRSWTSTPAGTRDGPSVTLLAGPRAGELSVQPGSDMRLPHLAATGGLLGERTLYAVHPTAPTGRRAARWWLRDLAVLEQWCAAIPAPIVAGDFNATLDHAPFRKGLGGCRSAAAGTGRGLLGTYPASLPRWLSIQIDHILVPTEAVTRSFSVLDVDGTDHRAVLASIDLSTAEPSQRQITVGSSIAS